MNAQQIEGLGYSFRYKKHYGRTVSVSIIRPDGGLVCTHWHTQGVIDAFNRQKPGDGGRMTAADEKMRNGLRLNDMALLQNVGR